jgi:hypothetical protein
MDLAESMAWLGRLEEALIIAQDVSAAADHFRIPLLQRRAEQAIAAASATRTNRTQKRTWNHETPGH